MRVLCYANGGCDYGGALLLLFNIKLRIAHETRFNIAFTMLSGVARGEMLLIQCSRATLVCQCV